MSRFGFDSTADEVLEGIDMVGRTILVTGGYSGLGHETARALADALSVNETELRAAYRRARNRPTGTPA